MASNLLGTPKMIVAYEWIMENVEQEPMSISSKMITFRGEKAFRVGLKNHARNPVLFFRVFESSKIGMKVEDVKYGIQGSGIGPATMEEMTQENIGDEGCLQLFTATLEEKVLGNRTFEFRICIEGTDPGYSYQLCDRLAKDELWAASEERRWADVELIVKDKTFFAHDAILAARSQVLADKFKKKNGLKAVFDFLIRSESKPEQNLQLWRISCTLSTQESRLERWQMKICSS
jgi:speckle-type POZ protein